MHDDGAQMRHVMEELMAHVAGDFVALVDGEAAAHGDVHFGVQTISDPAGPDVRNRFHATDVPGSVTGRLDDIHVDRVQHPEHHGSPGVDHDPEDRDGDGERDQWVGRGIARPHAKRTDQHGEAGPAIHASVIAVSDERGASDLPPDSNPEDGNRLVTEEPDDGGRHDGAEHFYRPRMYEPCDGFGRRRASQKATPSGKGRRGVGKVVDRVRQESDAA